ARGGPPHLRVTGSRLVGDGHPLVLADVVDRHDVEAVARAELDHRRHGARVVAPEPDVVPDDDGPGVQPVDEVGAHELLGGLAREVERVLDEQDGVETRPREQLDPVGDARDELGRALGAVHDGRVRVERHRHGASVALAGEVDDPTEHLGVAAVDAVEVADRHVRRAETRGNLAEVRPQVHARTPQVSGWPATCGPGGPTAPPEVGRAAGETSAPRWTRLPRPAPGAEPERQAGASTSTGRARSAPPRRVSSTSATSSPAGEIAAVVPGAPVAGTHCPYDSAVASGAVSSRTGNVARAASARGSVARTPSRSACASRSSSVDATSSP